MTDDRVLEIRTYRIVPGRRGEFARRVDAVLPLLAATGIEVLGHGPSIDDSDEGEHYVLVRSFASLDERRAQEAAFYGGAAWRAGPRDGILELIEAYHTVVLRSSAAAVRELAASFSRAPRASRA